MPVTPPPPGLREEDYERIEAAVMETARGRWFLTEFARRVREGESQRLLDALGRIERLVETAMETAVERPVAIPAAAPRPALAAARPEGPAERAASPLLARLEPLARPPAAAASAPAAEAAKADAPVDPAAAFAPLAALGFRERLAFFA